MYILLDALLEMLCRLSWIGRRAVSYTHLDVYKRQVDERQFEVVEEKHYEKNYVW